LIATLFSRARRLGGLGEDHETKQFCATLAALVDGGVAEGRGDGRVALNQLINVAVAEKVSALRTEAYFLERGGRAKRAETLRILAKAGKGNLPVEGMNCRQR